MLSKHCFISIKEFILKNISNVGRVIDLGCACGTDTVWLHKITAILSSNHWQHHLRSTFDTLPMYLHHSPKHLMPPIDDSLQARFDEGHAFEPYVESLYPNLIRLGFSNYSEYLEMPRKTTEAWENGEEVVSQGRGRKVRIVKFKRRKHHMKQAGHRQRVTHQHCTLHRPHNHAYLNVDPPAAASA